MGQVVPINENVRETIWAMNWPIPAFLVEAHPNPRKLIYWEFVLGIPFRPDQQKKLREILRVRVLLFDIDGTMVAGAGAGRTAMEEAFEALYGKPLTIETQRLSGRTDRGIGLELLREYQIVTPQTQEAELARYFEAYLERLPARIQQAPGRLLPGVQEILDHLRGKEGLGLGLLTGNLKSGAIHKLNAFGLTEYFAFGGYGDHHEDRDDVAREALKQSRQSVGPASEVWVIGDTPLDIRCARAIGAKVLAVATGGHPFAELEQHQPDLLLENLADVASVCRTLISC